MDDDAIAMVENELRSAEEDLSAALQEATHKAKDQFDLRSWIQRRLLPATAVAGALGFLIGMNTKP